MDGLNAEILKFNGFTHIRMAQTEETEEREKELQLSTQRYVYKYSKRIHHHHRSRRHCWHQFRIGMYYNTKYRWA